MASVYSTMYVLLWNGNHLLANRRLARRCVFIWTSQQSWVSTWSVPGYILVARNKIIDREDHSILFHGGCILIGKQTTKPSYNDKYVEKKKAQKKYSVEGCCVCVCTWACVCVWALCEHFFFLVMMESFMPEWHFCTATKEVRGLAKDWVKIGFLPPIFLQEIAYNIREPWYDPDDRNHLVGVPWFRSRKQAINRKILSLSVITMECRVAWLIMLYNIGPDLRCTQVALPSSVPVKEKKS